MTKFANMVSSLLSPVKSRGLNHVDCIIVSTRQVNVLSYKTRPAAKDFIQVEVVVDKNSQKIILIGKVSINIQTGKCCCIEHS